MENAMTTERLLAVWKRVEAARPKLEGSAKLMPRKKKRPLPRVPRQYLVSSI